MNRPALSLLVGLVVCGPAIGADEPPAAAAPTVVDTAAAGDAAPRRAPTARSAATAEIDLETTAIKGSQELPRVLVIVPWKKAQPGDIEGRPANSLLDEALAPVDREVFARQIDFYKQITTENTEE